MVIRYRKLIAVLGLIGLLLVGPLLVVGYTQARASTTTGVVTIRQIVSGALKFTSASSGLEVYNTADTTTNYERGVIKWISDELIIGVQKGGSGTNRVLRLTGLNGITFDPGAAGQSWTMPAATGHFQPITNNAVDVGATGTRPRTVYAATTIDLSRTSLGVTSADGVILANSTAAAAGAQQMSPRLRFDGFGWKTDSTAASQAVSVINELLPVQGTSAPTANLLWKYSVNGGAYSTVLTLSSVGTLTIPGGASVTGNVVASGALLAGLGSGIGWSSGSLLVSAVDGQMNVTNGTTSIGIGLDVATDAVLKIRTRAQSAYATVDALAYQLSAGVTLSSTDPTIAAGGCTSPAVTSANGTAAFLLTIGTSCTGVKTLTLTLPAAAAFWACDGDNHTSDAAQQTNYPVFRATSTTAVVMTSYDRVTGLQEDFTDSNTYLVKCLAN